MTVKASERCDGTRTRSLFYITSSIRFIDYIICNVCKEWLPLTLNRATGITNMINLFDHNFVLPCMYIAHTLTTLNPTQCLGFG